MFAGSRYLAFGLTVLAGYWFTVSRGIVYLDSSASPNPPGRAAHGPGSHPTFWGGGFHGGK